MGEQGEAEGSETAGGEGVAGRPDDFVQRQPELEQIAEEDEDRADREEGTSLCPRGGYGCFAVSVFNGRSIYSPLLARGVGGEAVDEFLAAVEADEGVGDGGDGAEQSLGVDGVAVVEVVVAEESEVNTPDDVLVDVGHVAVAGEEDDGVADEEDDDGGQGVFVGDGDGEESCGEITEGDALEHTEVAKVGEVPLCAVPPFGIPAHGHADEEEEQGAADYLADGPAVPLEVVFAQREIGGDSHDEEDEDEVGGGHAVPLGVLEDGERRLEAVVDEDHGGDGHAAQDVDGDYSVVRHNDRYFFDRKT